MVPQALPILGVLLIVLGTAAYASVRAAPWLPVRRDDVKRIIELADAGEDDLIYDLGSGDGRVLIAFARNVKSRVVGFEISLLPYFWSRLRIMIAGLSRRIEVRFGDFLRRDLSSADVIFCFLTPNAMRKLAPKFHTELKKDVRILSYSFSIPGWLPERVDKPNNDSIPIFVYRVGRD